MHHCVSRVKPTALMDHTLWLVLGCGSVDLGPYEASAARRMSVLLKTAWVHLLQHGALCLVDPLQRAPTTRVARPAACERFALARELPMQDTHALHPEEGLAPHGIVVAVSS